MKVLKCLRHPCLSFVRLAQVAPLPISDKFFLRKQFKYKMGKRLDLKNPETFNEKLQWLKLYDRKDSYATMVDKYEVKKYIARLIGDKYVIPTIGVYDRFNSIDFGSLPNQFVIKCTHDSGGLIVCTDKKALDIDFARKRINRCLKRNYYRLAREWPYKNVKPRIIIEKYLSDLGNDGVKDYKFFVFNGKVKCFKIDFDRFVDHRANYYDRDANLLMFGEEDCPPDYERKISIPKNYREMIDLAERISKDLPFVRVDFYDVRGRIYFGEITFYPAAGLGRFVPDDWDRLLGSWLCLRQKRKKCP